MKQTAEHTFDPQAAAVTVRAAAAGLDGVAASLSGRRLDAAAVDEMLADVRLLQRRAVGVLTALTRAALANAADGRGPVAEEALGADGTVGRTETRAEIERARVAERFPAMAAGVAAGSVHTGNIDVSVRLTSRMSDDEMNVLAERDKRIAEAAARLGEDSFRKRLQRMRDSVRHDNGATAAEQATTSPSWLPG